MKANDNYHLYYYKKDTQTTGSYFMNSVERTWVYDDSYSAESDWQRRAQKTISYYQSSKLRFHLLTDTVSSRNTIVKK